jgi:hypothetical protein
MTPAEAGQHLRAMMDAMYEGRSVRTPAEFQADLRALRVAADALDPPAMATGKREDEQHEHIWRAEK